MSGPERISGLTLQDLSALPRFGLKGVNTQAWLDAQGFIVGQTSNRAFPQDNGCLATRLSPWELLFLCDPQRPALPVDHDYFSTGRNCYLVRRRDSHYWFAISGKKSPSLLAKLCGVNFDPRAFTNGQVAQTQVARTSAIVVRNDIQETLCYYLLGDSSYCAYMKDCVSDAMHEDGGRIPGTQATNTARN